MEERGRQNSSRQWALQTNWGEDRKRISRGRKKSTSRKDEGYPEHLYLRENIDGKLKDVEKRGRMREQREERRGSFVYQALPSSMLYFHEASQRGVAFRFWTQRVDSLFNAHISMNVLVRRSLRRHLLSHLPFHFIFQNLLSSQYQRFPLS